MRLTGLIPSALACPHVLAAVPRLAAPAMPESELAEYRSWPKALPVLDQDGYNGCTYWSAAQALMYARHESGQPYVALDPRWAYLRHTGGRNIGTNILEAEQRLAALGMSPEDVAPGSEARQAIRFRWEIAERITTWADVLSEVARRRPVLASVCAGPAYQGPVDAEGVMGIDAGIANHAILLAGGLKESPTRGWMALCVSSWGPRSFDAGFGWYTRGHFDSTGYFEAYSGRAVVEDPADDQEPPS